jgi:hypothetical protein
MIATIDLQRAVVARLRGNAPLMARVTGIWDGLAPQGTAMPYVVIGEPDEDEAMVMGRGYELTVSLHVWSGTTGSSREAQEVARLIALALREPVEVPGYTDAALRPDSPATVLVEEDGLRHAWMRYGATIHET